MDTDGRKQESTVLKFPKFFKIITNPRADNLSIPEAFAKNYGRYLPENIFLKVPNGSLWKTELLFDSENEILFGKGWVDFRDHYSITFGQFLVFKYDGTSCFDVQIYDMTACEIEYLSDAPEQTPGGHVPRTEINIESESEDGSVVFLEGIVEGKRDDDSEKETQRKRPKAKEDSVEHFPVEKNTRRSKTRSPHCRIPVDPKPKTSSHENQSQRVGSSTGRISPEKLQKRIQPLEKEKCKAYQRAEAFKADNPSQNPSFVSLMQPSYVSSTFRLCIKDENFPHEAAENKKVKVRVCGRMKTTWVANCCFSRQVKFYGDGWKRFVMDDGIKVGDACLFQLSKPNKPLWDVTIFRN